VSLPLIVASTFVTATGNPPLSPVGFQAAAALLHHPNTTITEGN
jgi:hypothetical protein